MPEDGSPTLADTLARLSRSDFDRVNLVGSSGSGKSTLGRALAQALGQPVVEIDDLFWGPNWTPTPDETFLPRLSAALAEPRWVLDGNYDRTRALKWARATLVVWVDPPYPRVLWQVFLRTLKRSFGGVRLWRHGNRESLRRAFLSKDSILLWSFQNLRRIRRRYAEVLGEVSQHPQGPRGLRLRSRAEGRALLARARALSAP
jgi:adenylate kinase family enzyme